MDVMKDWFDRLFSQERRRSKREGPTPLLAYYWDGATPMPHGIRDISQTGLYLVTDERWYPGTLVRITLQREGAADSDPDRAITVQGKVVRSGVDGVGLVLVMPEKKNTRGERDVYVEGADRKSFTKFLQRLWENRGQAPH
jgi:hypothetical protein